jgi:hypothetical protein
VPFLRSTPIFLPLVVFIFLILPKAANAQVWVSSGFTPGTDAQHATAYCSTSAINPATGKASPAATDYPFFYAGCVVSGSDGSSFPGNSPACSIIGGNFVTENPSAQCTVQFPILPGVSYIVNAFHYFVLNAPGSLPFASVPLCSAILQNPNIISAACTDAAESIAEGLGDPGVGVALDPEGFFISVPPPYTPIYYSSASSITKEIVGSGTYQYIPAFQNNSYIDMCSKINNMSFDFCNANNNVWLEDQQIFSGWFLAFTSAQYCPFPAISSISPNVWFAGQSYDVTITGTGFTTAALATAACPVSTVTVTGSSAALVSNVNVVSATEITATIKPLTGPAFAAGKATPQPGAFAATVEVVPTPNQGSGPGPAVTRLRRAATLATANDTAATAPNADVLEPPQIVCSGSLMACNGQVISGGAASASVDVGQPVSLSTTPSAETLSDLPVYLSIVSPTSWTVGGTNIGQRVFGAPDVNDNPQSASFSPTVLTNADLTTYWLYPANNIPVTFEYCVQNQSASPATVICSPQATAYFNVSGPTAQVTVSLSSASTPPAYGKWSVTPPGPTECALQILSFGILAPGCQINPTTVGIVFNATNIANVPASGGAFAWLQVLDSWELSGTAPGGVTPLYPINGLTLDSSDPYSPVINGNFVATDSPDIGLSTPSLTTATDSFSATMYLMWSSNIDPDSINVPIGYVSWSINGVADNNPSATPPWSLDPNQGPTSANVWSSSDTKGPYPGLPIWNAIINSKPAPNSTPQSAPISEGVESQTVHNKKEKEQ